MDKLVRKIEVRLPEKQLKKQIAAIVLCVLLLAGNLPFPVYAAQNTEDIVILYENDVHCEVEGYSKLAAMKKELQEKYAHVGVVSAGDYIQGSSLGVVSRGEYIVNIMNLVGYDAVALGNHEFDYRLERLEELIGRMNTKPVCCNFKKIGEENSYFEPYVIVRYGNVDVAYIGITTPSTITSSSPAQFKEDGAYVFTFQPSSLYDVVQKNVDSAKAAGAEYIIGVSHIGYEEDDADAHAADIEDLIRNTNGFDVVLDAHSHSVIEGMKIADRGGCEVLLSSTGTKFEHIGKLTIANGELKTELIKTEEYQQTDPVVDAYLQQMYEEYAIIGDREIAVSEVDLITRDEAGNRLVRVAETNLGDLCADAFRDVTNADIAYVNGGGIREDILAGDITYHDLLNVFPFNNQIVLVEVNGKIIKDMLEMAMMDWPLEGGSFPHVSGLSFSVNKSIPSSVTLNEQEEFSGVCGQYRVYDIKVFHHETKAYEPIRPDDTYTMATQSYFVLEAGGGMTMFEEAKILQNNGMLDVEGLEHYIIETLNGVIGEEYRDTSVNITFTDGELYLTPDYNKNQRMIGVGVVILIVIPTMVLLARRRK